MLPHLPTIYQEIADGLYADYSPGVGRAAGDLHTLDTFCKKSHNKNEWEAPYKKWRQAYDMLLTVVSLPKMRPKPANWETHIDNMTSEQLRTLIVFSGSENRQKFDGQNSSDCRQFLEDFYRHYAENLQQIVCERALEEAATELTSFWQRNVAELIKLTGTQRYSQYVGFVNNINRLANNSAFAHNIRTGMLKANQFIVDCDMLDAAVSGDNTIKDALVQFDQNLTQMFGLATGNDRLILENMQKDFRWSAKSALERYLKDVQTLAEIRSAKVSVAAGRVFI